MTRSMTTLALLAAVLFAAGCQSNPAKAGSKEEVTKLQNTFQEDVSVGMSMAEVRTALKHGRFDRLSSSLVEGASVEEWKYEVFHDDDWNKTRSQFISFLYFVDGTLVQTARQRIPFEQNPEIMKQWISNVSKSKPAAEPGS